MNTARILQYLTFTLLLIAFFLPVSPATAATLTLTEQFAHEGLTFTQPLSFNDITTPDILVTRLVFGAVDETQITQEQKQELLTEMVIASQTGELDRPDTNLNSTNETPHTKSQPTLTTLTPTTSTQKIKPSPRPTTVTSLAIPTPTLTPSLPVQIQLSNGGLNGDKLFAMANDYRQAKGLAAFQKDERSCSLAASRAPEIANEIASDTMHSGLASRNLAYWNTENIIAMRNEEEAFKWWINDTIHREALEGNYTYSCVACSGNSCAQEFTNYQAK